MMTHCGGRYNLLCAKLCRAELCRAMRHAMPALAPPWSTPHGAKGEWSGAWGGGRAERRAQARLTAALDDAVLASEAPCASGLLGSRAFDALGIESVPMIGIHMRSRAFPLESGEERAIQIFTRRKAEA